MCFLAAFNEFIFTEYIGMGILQGNQICMSKLSAISIDDDPMCILVIKSLCKHFDFIHLINSYTDPIKGAAGIVTKKPDIVFIDVEMPEFSGLQIIKSLSFPRKFIVLSSNPDFEAKAMELNASAFIHKPTTLEKFSAALYKVRDELQVEA